MHRLASKSLFAVAVLIVVAAVSFWILFQLLAVRISPICEAAWIGDVDSVRTIAQMRPELVDEMCSPTSNTTFIAPPIVWAVLGRQQSAIALLYELGADIDGVDSYGRSPLYHAIGENLLPELAMLLELDADANSMAREPWSPLLFASLSGSTEAVDLLCSHGANPMYEIGGGVVLHRIIILANVEAACQVIALSRARLTPTQVEVAAQLIRDRREPDEAQEMLQCLR